MPHNTIMNENLLKEIAHNGSLIITENEKDIMTIDNKTITILTCYEWLLSDSV
ncbi:MAG: hypothetical protein JXJ04_19720 [Spirochaetales bacterium]|nr:hypothetical protein [Spirochaetales bacterium]